MLQRAEVWGHNVWWAPASEDVVRVKLQTQGFIPD